MIRESYGLTRPVNILYSGKRERREIHSESIKTWTKPTERWMALIKLRKVTYTEIDTNAVHTYLPVC